MPRVTFIPNAGASFASVSLNSTPTDGVVVGNLLYVCGSFSTVTDAAGTYARGGGACLNLITARWTSFDGGASPSPGLSSIASDGTYLYATSIGSTFAGLTGTRVLVRYMLSTGVIDNTWDIVGAPPFGIGHYFTTIRFINGLIYILGSSLYFADGAQTRRIAQLSGGVLTSWDISGNFAGAVFYYTSAVGIAEVSPGVLGIWGEGGAVEFLVQIAGLNYITAYGYANITESTGVILNNTNGYLNSFNGKDAAIISGVLYVGSDNGTGVRDLPANTVNASSRAGTYAVNPLTGAWVSAWNVTLTGSSLYCVAAYGTNIFAGGQRGNTPLFGLFDANGAPVTSFATVYPPGPVQFVVNQLIVYNSWLIIFGNSNGSTLNGRAVVGLNVFDAATGVPI